MTERTTMIEQYLQSIVEVRHLRYLEGVVGWGSFINADKKQFALPI